MIVLFRDNTLQRDFMTAIAGYIAKFNAQSMVCSWREPVRYGSQNDPSAKEQTDKIFKRHVDFWSNYRESFSDVDNKRGKYLSVCLGLGVLKYAWWMGRVSWS